MIGERNKSWIGVATKIAGRIAGNLVGECNFVLEAQLRQSQAQMRQVQSAEATACGQLACFRKTLGMLA